MIKQRTKIYFILVMAVAIIFLFFRSWTLEMKNIVSQPVSAWTEAVQADCAVVLTGGPNRVNVGIDLLYQGLVKKLIISGVNPDSHLEEIYPNIIFYGNIQQQDIVLEKNSKTTYGNAEQTIPLIEAFNCHDIILVTSRQHMYRALKTFRASYPANIVIYPHATVGKEFKMSWYQLAMESFKSLFYSTWAY
jgi:uncharacterized SAM-binding protein YcdF (DUF218 family)